jgi:hypothetical protein
MEIDEAQIVNTGWVSGHKSNLWISNISLRLGGVLEWRTEVSSNREFLAEWSGLDHSAGSLMQSPLLHQP